MGTQVEYNNQQRITEKVIDNFRLAEAIYTDNPPWLRKESPPLISTGVGILIASEIARLITIEAKINVTPSEAVDENARIHVNDVLQSYVMPNLRVEVEKGWALGGLIFKPSYKRLDLELNEKQEVVNVSGKLKIEFIYPSQFLINSFDNSGSLNEVTFFYTKQIKNNFYTLVEKHTFDEVNSKTKISNIVYATSHPPTIYSWHDLGNKTVPLSTIPQWAEILPEIVFNDVQALLIGYFKPATANNKNVNSSYGMSPLVRAANALERVDRTFNSLDWELDASMAHLYIDESAIANKNSVSHKLAKIMVKLNGSPDRTLFEKYSPNIRDVSYLNVYNAHLRQCEDIVGLARGTISNAETVERTATEFAMSRQRSYATVVDNQKALENAIRQLVYAMFVMHEPTQIINKENINMLFDFDDSIVSNPQEQVTNMITLVDAGIIPKYRVAMSYFNISEEDAKTMIEETKKDLWDSVETATDTNAENEFE